MTLKLYKKDRRFIHSLSTNEGIHKYLIDILGFEFLTKTNHMKPIVRDSISLQNWCFEEGTSHNELRLCSITGELPECFKHPRVGIFESTRKLVEIHLLDFASKLGASHVKNLSLIVQEKSKEITEKIKI